MKTLKIVICLGFVMTLAACNEQKVERGASRSTPKSFAGVAVGQAKAVSQAADDRARMIEEQVGE